MVLSKGSRRCLQCRQLDYFVGLGIEVRHLAFLRFEETIKNAIHHGFEVGHGELEDDSC